MRKNLPSDFALRIKRFREKAAPLVDIGIEGELEDHFSLQGERSLEVKGRAGVGDVELSENEWAKACNLRDRYWLYVVYDCASPYPRLLRVQDPFVALLVRARDGVMIDEQAVFAAAEVGT